MKPPPKRRKTDEPLPPSASTAPSPAAYITKVATSATSSMVHPLVSGVDQRVQQAKNIAVVQAQQHGCTGNFRIFDSMFGNYLVPVIPTRSELSG